MEKLDRILMSHYWEDLLPLVTVRKLVREVSDHNALLLDSGVHSPPLLKSRDFFLILPGLRMRCSFPQLINFGASMFQVWILLMFSILSFKYSRNTLRVGDQTCMDTIRKGRDSSKRS
jgi:hypothetical protein